jgi:hypothetical protein
MAESERNGKYITLGRLTDPFQYEAIKKEENIRAVLVSQKMKISQANKKNPQLTL